MKKYFFWLFTLILLGCSPVQEQTNPKVYFIQITSSTMPWLEKAITCAEASKINLSTTDNPEQADITLRLGEPASPVSNAFEIDKEEILVLANNENTIQTLQLSEVQKWFTQPGDQPIEVWAYSDGQDIQQVFNSKVLQGQLVLSTARLAVSPQQMGEVLNQNKNAIGLMTRHWKAGNLRELYSVKDIPVLALTKIEPAAPIKEIISCLQN
ncbi:MAG: hypothetical protein WCP19_00995 [Chloroflexota bacterium]